MRSDVSALLRVTLVLMVTSTAGFGEASEAAPKRPLLFVPGILGSTLVDHSGKVVWGDARSLGRFERLNLEPAAGVAEPLRASGLVETVQVFGMFNLVEIYSHLIEFLEKELGYKREVSLFVFTYDWRQSNFDNAKALRSFIDANPALRSTKFDLLCHSMGGLLARIYVQDEAGASHVHRLVDLAVPHQGSVDAIATMYGGWGRLPNLVAGGMPAIRRTVLSFPSLFELLPRYEKCCALGEPRPPNTPTLDLLEEENWSRFLPWLTGSGATKANSNAIAPKLAGARSLTDVMRRPLPDSLHHTVIAGRWNKTRETVYVVPARHELVFREQNELGDGTVHFSSARDGIAPAYAAFAKHGTIFNDRAVKDVLKDALGDLSIGPTALRGAPDVGSISLEGVSFEVAPQITLPNDTVKVRFVLTSASGEFPSAPPFATGTRHGGSAWQGEFQLTRRSDLPSVVLVYEADLLAPSEPGAYSMSVRLGDTHIASDEPLVVLER
jgi:pimeloyl-ACP methyl ester carboxylesterase